MSRDAKVTIDLNALRHNLGVVKRYAPNSSILAMIKSNAYGHGMIPVAKELACDNVAFGLACLSEAIVLRQAGIQNAIFIMEGFLDKDEIPLFFQYELIPVLHSEHQLLWLMSIKNIPEHFEFWLKLDTGMHRLGFYDIPKNIRHFSGIMTHLADADNPNKTFTHYQLKQFDQLTRSLKTKKSIANSAGILHFPESHFDLVRPGIMLYGVSPFAKNTGKDFGLKSVMELSAKLIAIKKINKAAAVGYGCTFVAEKEMMIGIVGIGYGDGYPRHAPNGTPTMINDIECPLVGRVSMDMIAIDLSLNKEAKLGDKVVLWGANCPIEKVASLSGTIAYELLCGISNRVKFNYENSCRG